MSNVVKISKIKKKAKSHVIFLSFLLIVAINCFLLMSPIFSVKAINVSGCEQLSDKEIINSSGICYGKNIMQIDKFSMLNNISKLPYVKDVIVKRNWPDTISITVKEKKAVAEVDFYGSRLLLDEEGNVLDVITDDSDTGLVTFCGISASSIKTGEKLKCQETEKLECFLEVLKCLNNNDMLNEVVKLEKNDSVLLYLKEGHVVNLGDTDNLQYKTLLLKEIVARESNTAYIDISNLNMIVTKPVWGMFNSTDSNEGLTGSEGNEE